MFHLKKLLIAFIAVLTFYGVEARAETFEINEVRGSVFVATFIDGGPTTVKLRPYFTLGGLGLGIVSDFPPYGGGDVGIVEARDLCMSTPCTPGMVIGTNSSFSGLIAPAEGAHARVYDLHYYAVKLTGALNFASAPITLPEGPGSFHVTIPFTFSGQLTGDALQPDVINPIFTATMSGKGMATFSFEDLTWNNQGPRYRLSYIQYQFEPIPISIDIKPATFPNRINPNSRGRIPVAILTTYSFDAGDVDPTTVLFGATGNEVAPMQSAAEDVDGDGDLDMVLHFVTQNTGITCGTVSASLTGAMFNGVKIKGSDSIETVPCN